MTGKLQIFKCSLCGNIIEVLYAGGGQLVCCGKPMDLYEENTVDAAVEKHVPVVEKVAGGYKVSVGSVAHPMVDDHYIEWIELIAGDLVLLQFLNSGDTPEAVFKTDSEDVYARAYCNLHGLWKSGGK